jgi:predicted DNA-binding transcriptional regulator AlpA
MKCDGPKFVSMKQIAAMMEASKTTAWRFTSQPGFPQPFLIGARPKWSREEVWAFMMSRRRSPKS